jgi:hypothetical protein
LETPFFLLAKLVGALIRVDIWIVPALALIVLAQLLQRRRVALALAWRFPRAELLFTGGSGALRDLLGPGSA